VIRGGWDDGDGDAGQFGIWLDLPSPDGTVRESPLSIEDRVSEAWSAGDSEKTLSILKEPVSRYTLDRHYLIQSIVKEAYSARKGIQRWRGLRSNWLGFI